jgi:nucleoside-diphosphate-sugar epimerase
VQLTQYPRILVTGASGYIGRGVIAAAVRHGYHVTGVTRRPNLAGLPTGVEYLPVDLEQPRSPLAFQPWRWDAVVHLAGTAAKAELTWSEGARLIANHVRSSLHVSAAVPAAWNGRFVLTSGFIVYGMPHALPVPEDHPRNPLHAYALAKTLAEDVVLAGSRLTDRWVLRLPGVFSVGRRSGALHHFASAAATGATATVTATSPTPWDVLHLDDAVCAILGALASNAVDPGPVNCGYGEAVELRAMAERLHTLAGRAPNVRMVGVERHPPFQLDVTRMIDLIGPLPATLDQRLLELLAAVDAEVVDEAPRA